MSRGKTLGRNKQTKASAKKVGHRGQKQKFLIFCEGQTESNYFDAFPVVTVHVKTRPLGRNRTSLVKKAINSAKQLSQHDTEVWVVFDMDIDENNPHCGEDFNEAIKEAEKLSNFNVAYSNDSFELWLLLHCPDVEDLLERDKDFLTRDRCCRILCQKWHFQTAKWKERSFNLYEHLKEHGDQAKAIHLARTLFDNYYKDVAAADRKPCTTVYKLVEKLNQYLQK